MPIRELRDLLEKAELFTEPMVLLSVDGVIEASNRAFADQLGLEQHAVSGRRLASLAALSAAAIEEYLLACARSQRALAAPVMLRRHDEVIPFDARAVGIRPYAGTSQVLLCLRAMQERAQAAAPLGSAVGSANALDAAESLRRQSRILEITLASIGDAVVVTDDEGRVSFLNAVAEALTAWTLESARQQPFTTIFSVIDERSRKAAPDIVAKVLQTGAVVGLANHSVLISRTGREIPIDHTAAPIRLPDGKPFGAVVIFRDITEQRRAERTRAWLSAIVDSSENAIVSKRLDGTITSWNPAAERLFGYTSEEIIGLPITKIVPPELHLEESAILARLRDGERIQAFDTVRLAKDGRRIDVSLTISPIRDEDGEIVGASKIATDISARKTMERELRDAERRKDEFLATLGHELRNPIAPIRNAVELLERLPPGAPETGLLSAILNRQVRVLTRLVDDLLDLGRVTAGHLQLNDEEVELAQLIEESIASIRPAVREKNQTLEFTTEEPGLKVIGDRVRLTQVFSNLLRNANKYTPPDGRIEVRLAGDSKYVAVHVRDNGIGIAPEIREEIFALFFRGDGVRAHAEGGLGIGLALARQIAQLHGGTIEALSAGRGHGSEFIVRLPRADSRVFDTNAPHREYDAPQPRRRILVAEDNPDAAATLAMLVRSMGHEVFVAHDGHAAVELADQVRPDAAFIDLAMPKLDGYEVARRIRERPWGGGVRLIALTGFGQIADRERTAAAGFYRHLVKPVSAERLRATLTEAPSPAQGG